METPNTVEVQKMASAAPTASQLAQSAQVRVAPALGPDHLGYSRNVRDGPSPHRLALKRPFNTEKKTTSKSSLSAISSSVAHSSHRRVAASSPLRLPTRPAPYWALPYLQPITTGDTDGYIQLPIK